MLQPVCRMLSIASWSWKLSLLYNIKVQIKHYSGSHGKIQNNRYVVRYAALGCMPGLRLQWLVTYADGRRAGLGLRNQKDTSIGWKMYGIVLLCLLSLSSNHCLFGIALGCQPCHIRRGLAGIHCLIQVLDNTKQSLFIAHSHSQSIVNRFQHIIQQVISYAMHQGFRVPSTTSSFFHRTHFIIHI